MIQLAAIVDAQNGTAIAPGAAAADLGKVAAPKKKGKGRRWRPIPLGAAVQSLPEYGWATARSRAMAARPQ